MWHLVGQSNVYVYNIRSVAELLGGFPGYATSWIQGYLKISHIWLMRLACQGSLGAWLSLEALDPSMSIVVDFGPENSFELDQITFIQSFIGRP